MNGGEKKPRALARSLGPKVPETVDDPTTTAEHEVERDRQLEELRTRMGEVRP